MFTYKILALCCYYYLTEATHGPGWSNIVVSNSAGWNPSVSSNSGSHGFRNSAIKLTRQPQQLQAQPQQLQVQQQQLQVQQQQILLAIPIKIATSNLPRGQIANYESRNKASTGINHGNSFGGFSAGGHTKHNDGRILSSTGGYGTHSVNLDAGKAPRYTLVALTLGSLGGNNQGQVVRGNQAINLGGLSSGHVQTSAGYEVSSGFEPISDSHGQTSANRGQTFAIHGQTSANHGQTSAGHNQAFVDHEQTIAGHGVFSSGRGNVISSDHGDYMHSGLSSGQNINSGHGGKNLRNSDSSSEGWWYVNKDPIGT